MPRSKWDRLKSGLYVPAFLKRLHRDERGLAWWPCPDCCAEEVCDNYCEHCVDNKAPNEVELTLSGIVEDGCGNCTDLHTPVIATWSGGTCIGQLDCCWIHEYPSPICEVTKIEAYRTTDSLGILIYKDPDDPILNLWDDGFGTLNCCTMDEQVTYHGGSQMAEVGCGVSSPVCQITAVQ